jgi:hypothetical protein
VAFSRWRALPAWARSGLMVSGATIMSARSATNSPRKKNQRKIPALRLTCKDQFLTSYIDFF